MSAEITRRVGSDASVLTLAIKLAKDGTPAQRVAIGIGLAKVIATCARLQPELESAIKQAVAAAGLSELSAAFAAGLGSLEALAEAVTAGGAESAAAPLSGNTQQPVGGGNQSGQLGSGGVASITTGTELLTINVLGPPASVTARSLSFSGKELTSTSGSTVSPTRP